MAVQERDHLALNLENLTFCRRNLGLDDLGQARLGIRTRQNPLRQRRGPNLFEEKLQAKGPETVTFVAIHRLGREWRARALIFMRRRYWSNLWKARSRMSSICGRSILLSVTPGSLASICALSAI